MRKRIVLMSILLILLLVVQPGSSASANGIKPIMQFYLERNPDMPNESLGSAVLMQCDDLLCIKSHDIPPFRFGGPSFECNRDSCMAVALLENGPFRLRLGTRESNVFTMISFFSYFIVKVRGENLIVEPAGLPALSGLPRSVSCGCLDCPNIIDQFWTSIHSKCFYFRASAVIVTILSEALVLAAFWRWRQKPRSRLKAMMIGASAASWQTELWLWKFLAFIPRIYIGKSHEGFGYSFVDNQGYSWFSIGLAGGIPLETLFAILAAAEIAIVLIEAGILKLLSSGSMTRREALILSLAMNAFSFAVVWVLPI